MTFKDFKKKDSVVVVFTGDGKGKTSAGIGMMARALGAGFKVAFVQFVKVWNVSEHEFIKEVGPVYKDFLTFYKGGLGFVDAGELSTNIPKSEHIKEAKKTFQYVYDICTSGDYNLVVCDEINNAVHDGLLEIGDLEQLIREKHPNTNLCFTGRNFPSKLVDSVDIVTEMTKVKHHYDDKYIANVGIDF
ncbi:cob(I)yrinic acid a,c-diamide adenosyltransferase [Candidatus Saccharibacteria bacterium]|nr:cob(I)yrinic acid a,c-diamide adenosyltransferase [Candidatus Saccharibacteria bacterium]